MSCLQSLRNAPHLTRFVLVWFALFMGIAVASPLVSPGNVQWVCTADGEVQRVVAHGEEQDASDSSHAMHCPLCLPMTAPPVAQSPAPTPVGLSHALHPIELARLAALIGLPWQARAPPSFS
jgi:hypothetical protein